MFEFRTVALLLSSLNLHGEGEGGLEGVRGANEANPPHFNRCTSPLPQNSLLYVSLVIPQTNVGHTACAKSLHHPSTTIDTTEGAGADKVTRKGHRVGLRLQVHQEGVQSRQVLELIDIIDTCETETNICVGRDQESAGSPQHRDGLEVAFGLHNYSRF
jgi:hypothetical protein